MRTHKSHRIPLHVRGLLGRDDIFRLSGMRRRDGGVDLWLGGDVSELRSIAKEWFVRMRQCGNDVRELMHDGCPVACVDDAPFGYVNTFNSHVNVGFFRGASLEDPAGLLEGAGKRMRHTKLTPGCTFDPSALRDLIDAAYVDIKRRIAAERLSKNE